MKNADMKNLRQRFNEAKRLLKSDGWTHILSVMADNAKQEGVEDFGSLFKKDGIEYWLNIKTIGRLPVEPTWMLETEAKLDLRRIDDDTVMVKEIDGDRQCELHIAPNGRLLFNRMDIETEAFMLYLGIMDEVICVNEVK